MRLLLRFTLALVASMLVVFAAHTVISVALQLDYVEESIRENQQVMGRVLKASVEDTWSQFGVAAAREVVKLANERESQTDIRYVALHEPHMETLRDELQKGDNVTWVDRRSLGVGRVLTYVPLLADGKLAAAIEITNSLQREREWLTERIAQNAITSLAVVIVCSVLAFLLGARLVAKPVAALMHQARTIGSGDFTVRSEPRSHDELGMLAHEMNDMAERLSALTKQVIDETNHKVAAVEQLRHAERLTTVGKLAAGIAHELGTPLAVVSGRAKRLGKDLSARGEDGPAQSAAVIAEQAERMTAIIRQLLDFARSRTPMKRPLAVKDVCASTVELLAPLANKRGVALELVCDADVVCELDATQMQQVVTNLLVNAIQASRGGQSVTVRVDEAGRAPGEAASHALIEVEDRGCGISDDDLSHIFEPFFTTKGLGEGTGLGLSVAYGIVHEHGGAIAVRSAPGHGSTFAVTLPRGATT